MAHASSTVSGASSSGGGSGSLGAGGLAATAGVGGVEGDPAGVAHVRPKKSMQLIAGDRTAVEVGRLLYARSICVEHGASAQPPGRSDRISPASHRAVSTLLRPRPAGMVRLPSRHFA